MSNSELNFKNELIQKLREGDNEEYPNFLKYYNLMEDYIKKEKLNNAKGMTNHSIVHINNVLKNMNKILSNNIFDISINSLYYLLIASIIHDLAMNNYDIRREEHHSAIVHIIQDIREHNTDYERILSEEEDKIICDIASSHSGNAEESYNYIINEYKCRG